MIYTIKQIRSNFENKFEIAYKNGTTIYLARSPWLDISMPFSFEKARALKFYDTNEKEVFVTKYNIVKNLINKAQSFILDGNNEDVFNVYQIFGEKGLVGSFYAFENKKEYSKFCIKYNNDIFVSYRNGLGTSEVISIFKDKNQIAQITKPLSVTDNKDFYILHLDDEYDCLLPILSFFTIYFDYCFYNNSGEVAMGKYSYKYILKLNDNNHNYNKGWIEEKFGKEERKYVDDIINELDVIAFSKIKNSLKYILYILIFFVFIAFVYFLIAVIV